MSKEMLTAASALLDYVSNHHRRLSSEFVSQGHNTSSTIHGFKRYDDTTVSQTTVLFVAAGLAFFTWRLWKFSLRPRLWPSEPLELPYWLPYIGHSLNFWRDSAKLIKSGRAYLVSNGRPSTEPFALTVGPMRLVIVTTGHSAGIVLNNTKELSWDDFLRRMAAIFGLDMLQYGLIWHQPVPGEERYRDEINPRNKHLVSWTEANLKHHLLVREPLDRLSSCVLGHIDARLHWKVLDARYTSLAKPVALMEFCADAMITELTQSLFGELIYDIELKIAEHLYAFNEESWKLFMFEYPSFLARKSANAKRRVYDAMENYAQSPEELREDSSDLMKSYIRELRRGNCNDQTIAGLLFLNLWGANANEYRFTHWLAAYILHDPSLRAAIRAETAPAFQTDPPNHKHIYDSCPLFTAVYNETLRCTFGGVSVRTVLSPITLQNKTLAPGSIAMIAIRELHANTDVFGPNANEFDARRFLGNDLDKSSCFRPFAGGSTYCVGRLLAKRLSMVFVATMLERFEIEVVGRDGGKQGVSAPVPDHVTPSIGIMRPKRGEEVFIRLFERTGS